MLIESSQYYARWRPVAGSLGDLQRQTNQLVITGGHFSEVQSFDNHHPAREQSNVRAMVARMKLFDRQVIYSDELHTAADQHLGRFGQKVREVFAKAFVPKSGVARMKQNAFNLIKVTSSQEIRINLRAIVRDANDARWPNQNIERQRIDLVSAFDEMRRRINVRSGVRAEVKV